MLHSPVAAVVAVVASPVDMVVVVAATAVAAADTAANSVFPARSSGKANDSP
jgi:hypothetical protein